MDRTDEILIPPDTDWLQNTDARRVCDAVSAEGGSVFFVGGCVRDALLGLPGADVDLSTNVLPQDVVRLAGAAGLKAVPTGIDHGTVTVVSGGRGFEITTFRRDVQTDGRRAVVAFSDDITEDARRRDFTMNAIYATPAGQIVDPLGGVQDCLNRRVRFIEDADRRIREDYLRILRFFRFHAWYAPADQGFDPDALDAIARNTSGLETLSGERTGHEMMRLLSASDPAPAVAAMRQTGCLSHILPAADDRFLGPVVHLEETLGLSPDRILRLAALGGTDVADRLRLSKKQTARLELIGTAAFGGKTLPELAWRHDADIALAALILRAACADQPVDAAELSRLEQAATAVFPVTAQDLMPGLQGKALGEALKQMEARWIASDFTLSRKDLMTPE
ncbi:CCA tRNA nucleotidyltransferase [uncultured Roseobacter sp.]|uniref:CCA tRNA nucleotidyltransferase n=1 Tax=uncultured Roseobacter sp. TaxID=114847 RepID=UPI002603D24B|nr:CCA tRNA nucleotidyltransferase [uncultured Roseobacter sp.]